MELFYLFLSTSLMALGHCVGMCGGVVLAYTQAKFPTPTPLRHQLLGHVLYNLGRVSTYMVAALIVAFLGHTLLDMLAQYSAIARSQLQGAMIMGVGGLIILLAFGFIFKWHLNLGAFSKLFKATLGSTKLSSFYLLGLLNGLLPCSLVYYFLLNVLNTPNLTHAFLTVLVLSLATFAPMLAMGLFSGRFLSASARTIFAKLAFVLMLGSGGYDLYKGFHMFTGHAHHSHMHMESMH
ncbi:sulfite exporter TauE/SafE family protein [Helicobacter baculiformis]|uniref:Sulfite exporter TauE/SafE family protein n=1 Tax=Helicobacter baculiformis TaxID=427351 RepID=A0ABV7ZLW6_9HELI|nr:sulfite exporter TauE/SafE family protein [Helicobacter baculiformis]